MTDRSVLVRSLATDQARLRVHGPDARRYLHGMVSNDVQGLAVGRGCHACLLSVKGKLVGDLVIYDHGEAGLFLTLVGAARQGVRATLDRHLIMDNATVEDVSDSWSGQLIVGESAAAMLSTYLPGLSPEAIAGLPRYGYVSATTDAGPVWIAAIAALSQPSYHLFGSPAAVAAIEEQFLLGGAMPLSADGYQVLRVEAGLPEYGRDLDEDRMPAEAGLDDAVSFSKGCYLGQEVVVRLRDRGHLNRKLCGLRLSPSGALPAVGTKLRGGDRPQAGTLTSVVRSPRFGDIALGYVHRSQWEIGTHLELLGEGDQPTGQTATICALPFLAGAAA